MQERLKALSVRQPWAELILRGEKTIEYRAQATKVRGPIYLYAPLAAPDADYTDSYDELDVPLDSLPRGVIVGTVEIVDCEDVGGEYEWSLAKAYRFDTPLAPQEQPHPV